MISKIPKKIHITWKDKNILQSESIFIRNCIGKLVELAPDWDVEISDDDDLEQYLRDNLHKIDYDAIKDKHIVEKCDVWRLFKLYNEGGLYTDIDRLCNTSINDIIDDNTLVVLPSCAEHDFSQDFMCSAPNNPMFLEALKLNLDRRFSGITDIYLLGPQTYFHGITKSMFGKMIRVAPGIEQFNEIRRLFDEVGYIKTYREEPPYNTIMYRPDGNLISFDHETEKRKFYGESTIKHWTNDW